MSGDEDQVRPSGTAAMIEALEVRRRACIGFALGGVLTMLIFVFFVVVPHREGSLALYVALALVLALSLGLLLTGILVLRAVIHLIRHPDALDER